MALLIASFFESGLFEPHGPAIVLIDRAYHRSLREAAGELAAGGLISAETAALPEPPLHCLPAPRAVILRHVEPHHHHVHIRVGPEPD